MNSLTGAIISLRKLISPPLSLTFFAIFSNETYFMTCITTPSCVSLCSSKKSRPTNPLLLSLLVLEKLKITILTFRFHFSTTRIFPIRIRPNTPRGWFINTRIIKSGPYFDMHFSVFSFCKIKYVSTLIN